MEFQHSVSDLPKNAFEPRYSKVREMKRISDFYNEDGNPPSPLMRPQIEREDRLMVD